MVYFPFSFTEFIVQPNNLSPEISSRYGRTYKIEINEYEDAFKLCKTTDDFKFIINKSIFQEFRDSNGIAPEFTYNTHDKFFNHLYKIFDVFNKHRTENKLYDLFSVVKDNFNYNYQSNYRYKSLDEFKDKNLTFILILNSSIIRLNNIVAANYQRINYKYTDQLIEKEVTTTLANLNNIYNTIKSKINVREDYFFKQLKNNINAIDKQSSNILKKLNDIAKNIKKDITKKKSKFFKSKPRDYRDVVTKLKLEFDSYNIKQQLKDIDKIKNIENYDKDIRSLNNNPYKFVYDITKMCAENNNVTFYPRKIEINMNKCIQLQSDINNLLGDYHHKKSELPKNYNQDIIKLNNMFTNIQNYFAYINIYFKNGATNDTILMLTKIVDGSGALLQNHVNKVFILFSLMLIILLVLITYFTITDLKLPLKRILPISILSGIICIIGLILSADQMNLIFK